MFDFDNFLDLDFDGDTDLADAVTGYSLSSGELTEEEKSEHISAGLRDLKFGLETMDYDERQDVLDEVGLDEFDLSTMDEDEVREAFEDAGLDPADYEF